MSFIVDAHLHVWDPDLLHYAWLADVPALDRRMAFAELAESRTPEHATVSTQPVDAYVFVQADCRDDEALAEVDWVTSIAVAGGPDAGADLPEHAPVTGIVAHAALEGGDAVSAHLDALRERPLVVGVRRLLQSERLGFSRENGFIAGARALADRGLTFDAGVTEDQLGDVTALADAAPDLRIVLDHLGKPQLGAGRSAEARSEGLAHWRAGLAELAQRPNTWCKLSGLPSQWPDVSWTPADLEPWLDTALEVFGAHRCLWASDWPASSMQTGYDRWLAFITEWAASLSPAERDAILGGSATDVYRLPH
jgi:L-fuconolactonase